MFAVTNESKSFFLSDLKKLGDKNFIFMKITDDELSRYVHDDKRKSADNELVRPAEHLTLHLKWFYDTFNIK